MEVIASDGGKLSSLPLGESWVLPSAEFPCGLTTFVAGN